MAMNFLNTAGLPLGLRNNNPGNIRPGDNWRGMIGTNGGFVQFKNIQWGIRALGIDLSTKIRTGYNTITKIISRYAPPSENDTAAYIKSVAKYTGINADQPLQLSTQLLEKLVRAIMNQELGVTFSQMVPASEISEGLALITSGASPKPGALGVLVAAIVAGYFLYHR